MSLNTIICHALLGQSCIFFFRSIEYIKRVAQPAASRLYQAAGPRRVLSKRVEMDSQSAFQGLLEHLKVAFLDWS